jgi:hypothetical protein
MAVYKIFASADTTLYSAYPTQNAGLDEILEVACKNSSIPSVVLSAGSGDDIRRTLIKFSNEDLMLAKNFLSSSSASYDAYLRLYLANAENLNTLYSIEIRQASQSWEMGTGKFLDLPAATNGACWSTTDSVTPWNNPVYYNTVGGGNWTSTYATQSFDYNQNKDLNVKVTNIVDSWFSGSENDGFLVKLPISVERNSGSYLGLSFFSVDTHTIYPPTLEFRWDDSSYITGSYSIASDSNIITTITNNPGKFKYEDSGFDDLYKFRIAVRDKFPARAFITSSVYTVNKILPATSYWAIQDVKTEEMIIDYDVNYTKISCDSNGSFFSFYAGGLEPERYYKILIKTVLYSGETLEIDNNNVFKIVR